MGRCTETPEVIGQKCVGDSIILKLDRINFLTGNIHPSQATSKKDNRK